MSLVVFDEKNMQNAITKMLIVGLFPLVKAGVISAPAYSMDLYGDCHVIII